MWVGQLVEDQLCLKIEQAVSCTIFVCAYCSKNKKGKEKKKKACTWQVTLIYYYLVQDYFSQSFSVTERNAMKKQGSLSTLQHQGSLPGTSSVTEG